MFQLLLANLTTGLNFEIRLLLPLFKFIFGSPQILLGFYFSAYLTRDTVHNSSKGKRIK